MNLLPFDVTRAKDDPPTGGLSDGFDLALSVRLEFVLASRTTGAPAAPAAERIVDR